MGEGGGGRGRVINFLTFKVAVRVLGTEIRIQTNACQYVLEYDCYNVKH